MSGKLTKIDELRNSFDEMYSEFQKKFTVQFNEIVKDIFEKYPKLESFGWSQYTPWFNDGEPCEFGVHAYPESIHINGYGDNNWEYIKTGKKTSWGADEIVLADFEKWKQDCADKVSEIVESIPEDMLQSIYGEGLVTINKDGTFDVEDYDHS